MKSDQIQRFSGQYFPTENFPAENFFGLNTEIYCGVNIYGENFSEGEYYCIQPVPGVLPCRRMRRTLLIFEATSRIGYTEETMERYFITFHYCIF